MVLMYIKQHLSNKIKQQWGWDEKSFAYKKCVYLM